jgi:pimeloyl-ACP methyl ester carboxylesterase
VKQIRILVSSTLKFGARSRTGSEENYMASGNDKTAHGPRRWHEQRWLTDVVVRAENIDWDQPRSAQTIAPIGTEATLEVNWAKARIRKYDDIAPAFVAAAERRERMAAEAAARGYAVTAAENHFAAAILYTPAVWAITDDDDLLRQIYTRINANYAAWMKHAPHRVERFELPFGNGKLPVYWHLPPGYSGGRLPTVLATGGMDTRKELVVAQQGDRFLARGFAVLSVDGPGRGEAPLLDSYVTADNWIDAGEVFMKFLLDRPEVDPDRIVGFGSSFGSFWMTQVAATQPRLKACATALCCHEPGCHTIFEEASPSYKKRFMWMSDIHNEDEFDRMAAQMDLRPLVGALKMPWLNIVGEKDELSPVRLTLELAARAGGPSPIVMYQGERHALSGASSIVLGPKYMTLAADWLLDRVNGKPAEEFLEVVLADGRIERRPHPRQSKSKI